MNTWKQFTVGRIRKFFEMKDSIRIITIIPIIAIIVLSVTSCIASVDSDDDSYYGFVNVTSIIIEDDTLTIGNRELYGYVVPWNATYQNIIWSVVNPGTTGATISENILSSVSEGTAVIMATIIDGKGQGKNFTENFNIEIVFGTVSSITNVPSTGGPGVPLTLSGTVNPPEATNTTIKWSVKNSGLTGATISENILTADSEGTVTVTATIISGAAPGTNYVQDFEIEIIHIPVTSITNVPSVGSIGKPLALSGMVNPASATNKLIIWSIVNPGTTGAEISENILTATAEGTVSVKATIVNGLTISDNYSQNFQIEILDKIIIIVPGTTLAQKLKWFNSNVQSNETYLFELTENYEVLNSETFGYIKGGVTVQLKGSGGEKIVTLNKDSLGSSLFIIKSGVTLVLDNNITLQGITDTSTISGGRNIVKVEDGGELVMLNGSKITGNITTGQTGGGVYVSSGGKFTMSGGEISNNSIVSNSTIYTSKGGGVFVYNGIFIMENGRIINNSVGGTSASTYANDGLGGGVHIEKGTFIMKGGEITGNRVRAIVSYYGGGVYLTDSVFTMTSGKINGNYAGTSTATGRGGGVYFSKGEFLIENSEVSNNTGAGLYLDNVSLTMANSKTMSNNGNGVSSLNGNITMEDCIISNNESRGIFLDNNYLTMTNCEILNNNGTGLYLSSSLGISTMTGVKISGNQTGVYVAGNNGSLIMDGGEISGSNIGDGGGVYIRNAVFTLKKGKIFNNKALNGGGVFVSDSGKFFMEGGEISDNTASIKGGGVFLESNSSFISKTGGVITGYSSDTSHGNVVKDNIGIQENCGHAVYVNHSVIKRKENTSGLSNNLDSTVIGSAGGWDN